MKTFLLRMLASSTLLLLLSCSDKPTENNDNLQAQLDQHFLLAFGQTSEIKTEGLEITFVNIAYDHRCPIDAFCIWPGMAEIELELVKGGADTTIVAAPILGYVRLPDSTSHFHIDTAGYRITLLQLDPQSGLDSQPQAENYRAILRISRSNGGHPLDGVVQITDLPPEQIQLDHFALDSVSVDSNVLTMRIGHGGGCANHYYFLYMSPAAFAESSPVQADLYLRHVDNDDPCDALLFPTLRFDLTPIAELYQSMYYQLDPIILNVHEYISDGSGKTLQVTYFPNATGSDLLPCLFPVSSYSSVVAPGVGSLWCEHKRY